MGGRLTEEMKGDGGENRRVDVPSARDQCTHFGANVWEPPMDNLPKEGGVPKPSTSLLQLFTKV